MVVKFIFTAKTNKTNLAVTLYFIWVTAKMKKGDVMRNASTQG